MPGFFSGSGGQPLPNHPDDFATLTKQFWLANRNRRCYQPALPTVPVAIETEMAYNSYFGELAGCGGARGASGERRGRG